MPLLRDQTEVAAEEIFRAFVGQTRPLSGIGEVETVVEQDDGASGGQGAIEASRPIDHVASDS